MQRARTHWNKEKEVSINKERKQKGDTHFGHTHPTFERVLIHAFLPIIGIHNGHVVVLKMRGEGFIPIQGLSPPETHGDGGWGPLGSGITTGSGGRDEGVGVGRRRHGKNDGRGSREKTPLIYTSTTLDPKNHHSNSPYCSQPPTSRFSPHQNSPYCPQPPTSRFSHHQNSPYYPQPLASGFSHNSRCSDAHRKVLEGQVTDR